MLEIRNYHLGQINSKVMETLKKPTSNTNFIEKYHSIAMQHYPLLLGRVHSAQQTAHFQQCLVTLPSMPTNN